MLGKKSRMPKGARYPLFLAGLAVILVGGIVGNASGYSAGYLAVIAVSGLVLMFFSVAVK